MGNNLSDFKYLKVELDLRLGDKESLPNYTYDELTSYITRNIKIISDFNLGEPILTSLKARSKDYKKISNNSSSSSKRNFSTSSIYKFNSVSIVYFSNVNKISGLIGFSRPY